MGLDSWYRGLPVGTCNGRDRTCDQRSQNVCGETCAFRPWDPEEDRRQARIRFAFQQTPLEECVRQQEKPDRDVKTLSSGVVLDVLVPAQVPVELPEAHGDDTK